MKKRLLILILAMVIITGPLTGCNGGKTTSGISNGNDSASGDTSPESAAEVYTPPALDLEGYAFKIAAAHYYDEADLPGPGKGVSELNDAVFERNRKIEEAFGCTISYDYYDPFTFFDQVIASLLSGKKFADVMTPASYNFGKFVNADKLYDLKKLPGVDLHKPWWNRQISEQTTFGKGVYGAGAGFAQAEDKIIGLFYNRRLLVEMGLEDPQKLVREGRWDLDAFQRYIEQAPKDRNNDGTFDDSNDWWAMTGDDIPAMNALFTGGGNVILRQTGGRVDYVLDEAPHIEYLLKMKELFAPDGTFFNPNWDYGRAASGFAFGYVLFCAVELSDPIIGKMEEDFGVVPFPAAPGSSAYHCLMSNNSPIVCVPSTIDNPKATGAVLEALAAYSQPEPGIWLDGYAAAVLRDAESIRMVRDVIIPNQTLELAYTGHWIHPDLSLATTNMVYFPVVIDRTMDPASSINEIKEQAQAMVDEVYNSH